jgi:tetratricopeptide (TPR) repeat protein
MKHFTIIFFLFWFLGLPVRPGCAQENRDSDPFPENAMVMPSADAGNEALSVSSYQEGLAALEAGRYSQAISLLEKAVDLDSNFAPAYNALGLAHQRMHAPLSDVIWFFDVAITIDSRMVDFYLNKCQVYQEAGQIDPAIKACQEALGVVPGHGKAELALAWLYLQGKDDADRAIHYFENILRKIQNPMIYYGLGLAYTRRGDNARVLDVIMILRNLGEKELASKLEQGIRPPEMPGEPPLIPPPAQVQSPPLNAPDSAAPITTDGLMKIRLRGKLTGVNPDQQSSPDTRGSPSGTNYR